MKRALARSILLLALGLAAPSDTNAQTPVPAPPASPTTAAALQSARQAVTAGRFDEALAALRPALAAAPGDVDLLRLKGAIERRTGDNAAALVTYEALARAAPDDATTGSILALLLADAATRAPPAEATAMLMRAMALSDAEPEITAAFIRSAGQAKQPEAVAAAFARLPADYRLRPDVLRPVAEAYRELGRFDDAAATFGAVLATDSNDQSVAEAYVDALVRGAPANIGPRLDAATRLFPDSAPLLRAYADWSLKHGSRWQGLNLLTRLQVLTPRDTALLGRRAALLAELGGAARAAELVKPYTYVLDPEVLAAIAARAAATRAAWKTIDVDWTAPASPTGLLTLAYGDITDDASPVATGTTLSALLEQLEYLHAHDFHFVGIRDLAAAMRRKRPLPERAVLLLFQGGHASFRERALPVLEQYGAPAVLAIPTAVIEAARTNGTARNSDLLTWPQIKTLAGHRLVTIASATHALAASVPCNPQGRLGLAVNSRIYTPNPTNGPGRYETAGEYHDRIDNDLREAQRLIKTRVDRIVDVLLWPEGAYSSVALEIARTQDYGIMFAERRSNRPNAPDIFPIMPVSGGRTLAAFARSIWLWGQPPASAATDPTLAMPVDLRPALGRTPAETRANLAALVERAIAAGVDAVHLGGCLDEDGDGAAESALFHNRTLPVKADILDDAASLFRYRGIRVLIAMPTIGIRPRGVEPDPRLFVMQYRWGRVAPDTDNLRLTPFHPDACRQVRELHADLAAYVHFDGVIFGPDAHLTDTEDVGPLAMKALITKTGIQERNPGALGADQRAQRDAIKTETLDALLRDLRIGIAQWNPAAEIVRCLAAPALLRPDGGAPFAQSLNAALSYCDTVCVDADPELYDTGSPEAWLTRLGRAAAQNHVGSARVLFDVALQPGTAGDWISNATWEKRNRTLAETGARRFSYTPDLGVDDDQPFVKAIAKARRELDEYGRKRR